MKNKMYTYIILSGLISSCSINFGMELTAQKDQKRDRSLSPARISDYVTDKIKKLSKSSENIVSPSVINENGETITKIDMTSLKNQITAKKKEKRHSKKSSNNGQLTPPSTPDSGRLSPQPHHQQPLVKTVIHAAEKLETSLHSVNQQVLTAIGNNTTIIETIIEPIVGQHEAHGIAVTIKKMVPELKQAENNLNQVAREAEEKHNHHVTTQPKQLTPNQIIAAQNDHQHKLEEMAQEAKNLIAINEEIVPKIQTAENTTHQLIQQAESNYPTNDSTQSQTIIPQAKTPILTTVETTTLQTPVITEQNNNPVITTQKDTPPQQPALEQPFYKKHEFIMIGGVCVSIVAIIAMLYKFNRLPDKLAQILDNLLPQSSLAQRLDYISTHAQK